MIFTPSLFSGPLDTRVPSVTSEWEVPEPSSDLMESGRERRRLRCSVTQLKP